MNIELPGDDAPAGARPGHRRIGPTLGRLAGLIVAGVALSGCGVPLAVTIVSYAADGVSAATTGKTLGDHALSAVVGEDCALWRVFDDREICMEVEERQWAVADPAVLAAAPRTTTGTTTVAATGGFATDDGRRAVLPANAPAGAVAALAPSTALPTAPITVATAGPAAADPLPLAAPTVTLAAAPLPVDPVPLDPLPASALSVAALPSASTAPAIDPPMPPRRPANPAADGTDPPNAVPLPPTLPPRRVATLGDASPRVAALGDIPRPPALPPLRALRQVADARF